MQRVYTYKDAEGKKPLEIAVVTGSGTNLYRAAERAMKNAESNNSSIFLQFERNGAKSQIYDISDVKSLIYLKLTLV